MPSVSLALTPHGHLTLVEDPAAASLDEAVAKRLHPAFDRGSGHGLLQLGAAETATTLPPVFAFWREFAARYITALCTQPESLKAPRPRYSALSTAKLAAAGFTMPGWRDALRRWMTARDLVAPSTEH